MTTFRVSIRRPATQPPIWDFAKTVVAPNENDALNSAYNSWVADNPTPPPPPLNTCQWQVIPTVRLNKEHEDTHENDIHELSVEAIHGVSKSDADALEKSLGIKTIGDLAAHPLGRAANLHAGNEQSPPLLKSQPRTDATDLPPVVLLDQMVSSFRNSHRNNFRPMSLLATDNSGDDLFSMVQASKDVPASTSIAVVDTKGPAAANGKPTQDALLIYNDMLTLSSLANVVAMKNLYKAHPAPFDITNPKEASAFIKAQAMNLNDTFTRQLGAYALPGETTAESYNKTVLTADLHLEFLTTLFSSFNFPPAAMTKLDGILTQVKEALANLKVGLETETQTLDHIIFTNYIDAIDIQGLDQKVLAGKIRMFYLKIDQSSWKATVGKSTVSKLTFNMNYFDTIFSINSNLVRSDISSITELIKKFTNHSFEEMSKLTSPTVIQR